ncbi:hypothetical protein NMG60_11031874, partial [Bertholletia excelsa]
RVAHFILTFQLLFTSLSQQDDSNFFLERADVHVINRLPSQLKIHCRSKDNDLGERALNKDQEFSWKFKTNIFGTTLYWCNFTWGAKFTSFDVFNKTVKPGCQDNIGIKMHCYWEVRSDGFYFSRNNKDYQKACGW